MRKRIIFPELRETNGIPTYQVGHLAIANLDYTINPA